MTHVQLKGWRINPQAVAPVQATAHSACWDLAACLTDTDHVQVLNSWNEAHTRVVKDSCITLFGGERALIPTGWVFDIPVSHSMRLHARSGLAWKQGICLANSEGVIDADYVKETFVAVWNTTDQSHTIRHGDRISQMEIVPMCEFQFDVTDQRPEPKSDRVGGFGSTGVHS